MKDKQARAQAKLIKEAERLYLKAAENAGNKRIMKMILAQRPELEEELEGEKKVQMSFAGPKAKTADKIRLANAQKMLDSGADSETVRKETGWFKGYDGKWRFEIDDSNIEIAFNGKHSRDPEIRRYAELVDKVYFLDTATQEEQNELVSLDEKIGSKKITPASLGDLIDAPELFEAYPELQDVGIYFTDNTDGVSSYHPGFKEITLPKSLKREPTKAKKSLLHEIQHAIQDIEDFASGGNLDSNRAAVEEVMDIMELTEVQKSIATLDMLAKYSDNVKRPIYDKLLRLSEKNGFETVKEYIKSLNSHSYYKRIAGEVEARDVANRSELSAEERKNTRPDIDRKDVVFADSASEILSYIGDTKDGRRCYRSGFDDSVNMDERIKLFKERIATIFNLGAVELKTDVKKIKIRGDRFTAQKNIYGDKMKTPKEQESKVNALYDLADILASSTYDPNATSTDPSYINPSIKPKNPAHKNVKYWYKFRNNIVFDGIPYTVTFNIRDKGKEQFQYLIDFKEDKTPGLSNTAVKNLLRADQASYSNSISYSSEKSNSFEKKTLENISRDEKTVQLSLKSSEDTVNISKGELAKIKANYKSDKVFNKNDVVKAINSIEYIAGIRPQLRNELINRVWKGYNERLDMAGYEKFTEVMYHRIHATILQETSFEMNDSDIVKMDEQIAQALVKIVESGKPSEKAKLESATSTEGYRKQAEYWRNEHIQANERRSIEGRIMQLTDKVKNIKKGAYLNASQYNWDIKHYYGKDSSHFFFI